MHGILLVKCAVATSDILSYSLDFMESGFHEITMTLVEKV